MENFDMKKFTQSSEFVNLTVEEAIRRIGEKEKDAIITEGTKTIKEFKNKLDEKVILMKSNSR